MSNLGATGRRFLRVSTKPMLVSTRRSSAAATMVPSGRTMLNVEASEELNQLFKATGIEQAAWAVEFGVNAEAGQVAVYVVRSTADGAVPVRWYDGRASFTLYLGGVFEEYPQLAVKQECRCAVTRERDADGQECLVLALNAALPRRAGPGRKAREGAMPSSAGAAK